MHYDCFSELSIPFGLVQQRYKCFLQNQGPYTALAIQYTLLLLMKTLFPEENLTTEHQHMGTSHKYTSNVKKEKK